MANNLWSLVFGQDGTLPVLVREGTDVQVGNINYLTNTVYDNLDTYGDDIDVVKDFPWTKSPKSSRTDVPKLILKEKRLKTNSTVSNAAYSLNTLLEAAPAAEQAATAFSKKLTGKNIISTGIGQNIKDVAKTISDVSNELQNVSNEVIDGVVGDYETFGEDSVLTPYNGLYRLEKTGFKYILPYLQDDYNTLANAMNVNAGENVFSFASDFIGSAADQVAGLAFALRPGVYIEESQQYNMPQTGRKVSVSFPLLNTGNYSEILQNWQFLFGLIYQNRPGRITKTLVDIPVLYESIIEGNLYMPYSYITNLEVKHLGNRRNMKITIPKIETTNETGTTNLEIETIIPDAYQVDITLTGLNEETRNFLFESIKPGLVTSRLIGPDLGATDLPQFNNFA